ncbi:MAG: hypothetical protein AAF222_05820 [Pseudomonadota bacterium]
MTGTLAGVFEPSPTTPQIVIEIAFYRALWRSSMTGWWQIVVPPQPFVKRAIFWACVWFAIGALTLILRVLEIAPSYVFAGLIGAAFLISVFGYLHRTRMERFWDVIGSHWDKAGVTHAIFAPDGVELSDDVSQRQMTWLALMASRGGGASQCFAWEFR